MQWAIVILLFGISFTLWLAIGAIRLAQQRTGLLACTGAQRALSPADVAVIIPAHNEELTIAATLESATRLVSVDNIHVVADGCDDQTAAIAHGLGARVLALSPAGGKAAGIEAAVKHFDLCRHFAILLILDADTEVDQKYLERGLTLLRDPAVSAVAGYAHTTWRPEHLSMVGRLLVSYRTRLYAVMQWIRYGQTWKYTNVSPIVPGFASMYRTSALSHMDLNPPGLVIEDFNMTFQLHRKRLGKIAFEPSVFARTQDPDNLQDYYRQVKRWWLGLWQTVRRHGVWCSWFSAALCVFLVEVVVVSILLILVALAIMLLAADSLGGGFPVGATWYTAFHGALADVLSPTNLLLFVFVPDYALTCAVALWLRRPSLLVYGPFFLLIRLLDSTAALWGLPKAWYAKSSGRWRSPRRQPSPVPVGVGYSGPSGGEQRATGPGATATVPHGIAHADPPAHTEFAHPVVRDMLVVLTILTVTGWLAMVAVPLTVVIAGAVLLIATATLWSHLG